MADILALILIGEQDRGHFLMRTLLVVSRSAKGCLIASFLPGVGLKAVLRSQSEA